MSIVVEMDKEKDFIHAQSESYPFSSLMSDIGGAAGLFLGLSVVVFGFKLISYFDRLSKTWLIEQYCAH